MSTKNETSKEVENMALKLTKAKIGISTQIRDEYLSAIVNGVANELKEINGIEIDLENPTHLMYVVDLSVYRYENHDDKFLPVNLQRRLHNLIIMYQKKAVDTHVER